jgi:WD40 repeat protein
VQAIAASGDGTLAAGGGDDGTLRVWHVGERKLVVEFAAPKERIAER